MGNPQRRNATDRGGTLKPWLVLWACGALGLIALPPLGLSGCAAKALSSGDPGSETHWLSQCSNDSECTVGRCWCGVCTKICETSSECDFGSTGPGARCIASGTAETCNGSVAPPPSGLCLGEAMSADGLLNPSGDCVGPVDGGRINGSHGGLEVSDRYVPDCQLELAREYYSVFRHEDGTAHMIPRPDGNRDLYTPCTDSEHELAAIVERYGLCEAAASEAAVNVVNAMDLSDALRVAHYLHSQLVFYPLSGGGLNFLPRDSDFLAACKADEVFRTGPLVERCNHELMYENSDRPGVSFVYDADQALAIAVKMNGLYGIAGDSLRESEGGVCDRLQASAERATALPIAEADRSCTRDEDCTRWWFNPCYDAGMCGVSVPVAVTDASGLDTAFAAIEAEQCSLFATLGCEAPGLAPCSFAPITCRDNVCQ